jgi:hypothetical protein
VLIFCRYLFFSKLQLTPASPICNRNRHASRLPPYNDALPLGRAGGTATIRVGLLLDNLGKKNFDRPINRRKVTARNEY